MYAAVECSDKVNQNNVDNPQDGKNNQNHIENLRRECKQTHQQEKTGDELADCNRNDDYSAYG